MSGAPFPGPTQPYAPPYDYNNNNVSKPGGDYKDPYSGDRFKPKKKINDPIFLILFILQVPIFPPSLCHSNVDNELASYLGSPPSLA